MGWQRHRHWIGALLWALAAASVAPAPAIAAAPASSLSKWLSQQVVPDLREQLRRHPRYENQRVAVASAGDDALSAAIVTVLLRSFPSGYDVSLQSAERPVATSADPASGMGGATSLDDLACTPLAPYDYLLRAKASRNANGLDEVYLALSPVQQPAEATDSWRWTGRFTSAERTYQERPDESALRLGSPAAPWSDTDAELAARKLVRELACALRPQVATRLTLQWPQPAALPGVLSDTVNISRHLLGQYRELAVVESATNASAYKLEARLVPFSRDTWQLWLVGAPRRAELAPVQAVAYFSGDFGSGWPAPGPAREAAALPIRHTQAPPPPAADPLDYLDVQLLDATQVQGRGARAQLQVTVQLANRAQWPLEYSFTLSGGHFNHCIALPEYYRHDSYGSLDGRLAAGEKVVRRLVIDKAQHKPRPLFGTRKCAGFRDLEGFEQFSRRGHKVTDYVRWQM